MPTLPHPACVRYVRNDPLVAGAFVVGAAVGLRATAVALVVVARVVVAFVAVAVALVAARPCAEVRLGSGAGVGDSIAIVALANSTQAENMGPSVNDKRPCAL